MNVFRQNEAVFRQSEAVFQNAGINFNLLNDKNQQQHKILENSELKTIQRKIKF